MSEAFNIKVGYGEKEVTLTILPDSKGNYKVIYYGGIMGGVFYKDGDWELISVEELEAGDLPVYIPDLKGERLEIVLDEFIVNTIGDEIELYYDGNPQLKN